MTLNQTICSSHFVLRARKQRDMFYWGWKCSKNQLQMKNTFHIAIFNVRTWDRISQLPELASSAAEHNIDIECIQEHGYYQSEQEIQYYDTSNGWTFVSVSAWKNSVSAIIGEVGMLLRPHALKSLNCIEKIQQKMRGDPFNGNPRTIIISC